MCAGSTVIHEAGEQAGATFRWALVASIKALDVIPEQRRVRV